LYKVDKSGKLKWSYVTGAAWYDGSAVGTNPALDADGNIIFGSRDKKLYAVDSNGSLQWSFDTGGSIYSSPKVDVFGNIYFGSADGNVYKLGETAKLVNIYSIPLIVDNGMNIYDYENYILNEAYSLEAEQSYDTSMKSSVEAFTDNEPSVLDEALKILHLTRSNLNEFEYASTEMQARLSSVTLSLDDPVAGAEYSKLISDSIANSGSLGDLVRYAAYADDFTINPVDFSKELGVTPLETAIRDVFTNNGTSISAEQEADLLNQLTNVPLDIQKGAALILYALDESLVMLKEAFSSLTQADKNIIGNESFQKFVMNQGGNTLKGVIDILDKVNKQKLYGSCLKLLSAIEQAETHFSHASGISNAEYLLNFGTPIGKIVIGGSGANNYTDDSSNIPAFERTMLLIDTGGDDIYKNKGGSSTLVDPISILLDLGGDDEYDCVGDFSQGSGRLGHGILIDYDGADKYFGSDLANAGSGYFYTQGSAFFGVGILDDRGSDNDIYIGDYLSQGASTIGGLAILNDDGGNDKLYCREYSQAFGFIKGVGIIRETSGNDFYASGGTDVDFRENAAGQERYVCMSQGFGFGARRDTFPANERYSLSGGCGILVDMAGNDVYSGDYFAQGSSYWYALGILNDRGGNDLYYARRYSQGTGTHVSVGYLIDSAGDDFYQSWIVSQGHGLDSSVGVLIDMTGNDIYSMKGWYGQGAGGGGLGILVDNAGNDIYYAYDTGGQGFGDPYMSNVYTPIGIVIDVGGFDLYSQCYNNQRRTKYSGGITIDVPSGKSGFLSD
ncbi:PQQ-binding-like beta-propeller repeat protein, partial [bacterium]|nr:PQQ-binding-like beta-propeller repeat protein [bacterium]